MAIVSLVEHPSGLLQRYAWRYSKKRSGAVLDPIRAAAHHNGVLMAAGVLESVVEKRWTALEAHLRLLAIQATSAAIGCSWCTDYGYWAAHEDGVDPRKLHDVARWRDSDAYDERERLVLEYAEAVNQTPTDLAEDLAGRLRAAFSEAEIVELAGWVALENNRSRFNAGLGLISQGFSDRCAVPLRPTA